MVSCRKPTKRRRGLSAKEPWTVSPVGKLQEISQKLLQFFIQLLHRKPQPECVNAVAEMLHCSPSASATNTSRITRAYISSKKCRESGFSERGQKIFKTRCEKNRDGVAEKEWSSQGFAALRIAGSQHALKRIGSTNRMTRFCVQRMDALYASNPRFV